MHTILSEFKRLQFLDYKEWLKTQMEIHGGVRNEHIRQFLMTWRPKIGLYAGSFNPMHIGHLNIIEKSEKIFDKVIIAYGKNPDKHNQQFPIPESIKNRQIIHYEGLLTDMINNLGYDVTLIRGLRNSTDLQYELTQFQFLQELKPDIQIVNIFCDKQYEHLSSSAIRNLLMYKTGYQYIVK